MREARLDWPAAVPLWMFSVCVRVSKWRSGAAASEATSTQTEDKQSAGKEKTPQVFKTTAWNKSWTEGEELSRQRSEVRDRLWEFVSETEEI